MVSSLRSLRLTLAVVEAEVRESMSTASEPPSLDITRWLLGAIIICAGIIPVFARMLKGYKKGGKDRSQ